MRKLKLRRPSAALIVALVALVAAMSGAAIALPGKNSVDRNDIQKGAVKTKAIANGAVTKKKIARGAVASKQIKGKSIKGNRLRDKAIRAKQIDDETITSAQVAKDGLNSSNIADYKSTGMVRLTATEGPNADAAREAAPETVLVQKGDLTVYAKCFRDNGANEVKGAMYIRTATPGAILDASSNGLPGGSAASEFLNPDTPEVDREIDNIDANPDDAEFSQGDDDAFRAFAPDGTALVGLTSIAVKQGNVAVNNGVYGAGDVCLFSLQLLG